MPGALAAQAVQIFMQEWRLSLRRESLERALQRGMALFSCAHKSNAIECHRMPSNAIESNGIECFCLLHATFVQDPEGQGCLVDWACSTAGRAPKLSRRGDFQDGRGGRDGRDGCQS